MDYFFLLVLVIAYSTVSIAWDLKIKSESGGEKNGEIATSLIEDNNGRFDPREEKLSFGDDKNIEIGVKIPSNHHQVSPSALHDVKTPPQIIPSGVKRDALVKRRTRRMAFRTKCIPKVKNFCRNFTVGGITKLFCVARKVFDCAALD